MHILKHHKALAAVALFSSLVWPACGRQQREAGSGGNGAIPIPNFHHVKTVIDLRREDEHSTAAEAQAVAAAGMHYVNIPMKGVVSPSSDQIARVLTLLNSNDPVFVHCKRGADRTGTVIACYRIAHDGWQRQRALEEAKSYGMGTVQLGLKHYIMGFKPDMIAFQPAQ